MLDIIERLLFFEKIAIIFLKRQYEMWQKFLYSGFLIVISSLYTQVYAQTVEVSSLSNFSTEKPPKTISVKLSEPLEVMPGTTLKAGVTMNGSLIDVVSPKRLKRDAGFSFKPLTYTDLDGKSHKIKSDIKATYTKPIDKGKFAKSAALGVGSYFVKGLSVGVAAVEGAIQNDEGNRLKSSAVSVYESSPLSYVEKGQELTIETGQTFYLKFPDADDLEQTSNPNEIKGQNYEFTIEKE